MGAGLGDVIKSGVVIKAARQGGAGRDLPALGGGTHAGWGGTHASPGCCLRRTGGSQPILAAVPQCHQMSPVCPMPPTVPEAPHCPQPPPNTLRCPRCPQGTPITIGAPHVPLSLGPGVPSSGGVPMKWWGAGCQCDSSAGARGCQLPPRVPSPCVTAVPTSQLPLHWRDPARRLLHPR